MKDKNIMAKQEVTRSTELFITCCVCGKDFSWIPDKDLDKVSITNTLKVKCPKCGCIVIIYEIDE